MQKYIVQLLLLGCYFPPPPQFYKSATKKSFAARKAGEQASGNTTKIPAGNANPAQPFPPRARPQEYMVNCSQSWSVIWTFPSPARSRDLKARNMLSRRTRQLMKLLKSMLPSSSAYRRMIRA